MTNIFQKVSWVHYPLVMTNIAMENHQIQWENWLFLWWCSIAMLNYQRVTVVVQEYRRTEGIQYIDDDLCWNILNDANWKIFNCRDILCSHHPKQIVVLIPASNWTCSGPECWVPVGIPESSNGLLRYQISSHMNCGDPKKVGMKQHIPQK